MGQVSLRLPDNLKDVVRRHARDKGVSLNAFILQLLWDWFEFNKIEEKEQV